MQDSNLQPVGYCPCAVFACRNDAGIRREVTPTRGKGSFIDEIACYGTGRDDSSEAVATARLGRNRIDAEDAHMRDFTPVETRYNGMYFRSRLEARWAVFFDCLGIQYQYEPEKFETPEGRYIPDFFIPGLGEQSCDSFKPKGIFFEVKGERPSPQEETKVYALSGQTSLAVAMFWGSNFTSGRLFEVCADNVAFTQCPFCGLIDLGSEYPQGEVSEQAREILRKAPLLEGADRAYRTASHFCFKECELARQYNIPDHFCQDYVTPPRSPMLDIAIETAMSVRFEQPGSVDVVKTAALNIRRLREAGVFCFPEQRDWVLRTAAEWASVKKDWMRYEEPWYVRHKANLDMGISPCTCYHCKFHRDRRNEL